MRLYPPRKNAWAESRRIAFEASMEVLFAQDRAIAAAAEAERAEAQRLVDEQNAIDRVACLRRRAKHKSIKVPAGKGTPSERGSGTPSERGLS
jgi:hypothetical protein